MQLIEMLEARRLHAAGPGDVDATFGTDGVIALPELLSSSSSSLITLELFTLFIHSTLPSTALPLR